MIIKAQKLAIDKRKPSLWTRLKWRVKLWWFHKKHSWHGLKPGDLTVAKQLCMGVGLGGGRIALVTTYEPLLVIEVLTSNVRILVPSGPYYGWVLGTSLRKLDDRRN